VFTTEHGSPIQGSTATRAMQAWCKRAGIPVSGWHALRHWRLSRWATNGMDLATLMYLAGHARVSTTMEVYVHTTSETAREAARKYA
jgi:integrase